MNRNIAHAYKFIKHYSKENLLISNRILQYVSSKSFTPLSQVEACIRKSSHSYMPKFTATHRQNGHSWFKIPFYFMISFSIPFFVPEKKNEDPEEEIVTTMKYAVLAFQRGDYAKAEQLLHVSLKSAQETNNAKAVTYIYDLMGNFALQNGDFKKAEVIFVDVLKRFLQSGIPDDDNAVVDVSLKLASIHANLGENDKANMAFEFCIGTQDKKLKDLGPENVDEDTIVLWAMSHDWFARYLLSIGQYSNAKEHFRKAYDVCVKIKGEDDPQSAVLLNDLGSVCSLQQNYDEAVDYLNKAIVIGEQCESDDLASFYVNLGTVYIQKKMYDEAHRLCSLGKNLARKNEDEITFKESKECLDTIKNVLNK